MSTLPAAVAAGQSVYQDFEPKFELLHDHLGSYDILGMPLPNFTEEQVRLQIDNSHGKLEISGERPLGANQWSRFRKEFPMPENLNLSGILTMFEDGFFFVILPKRTPKDEPEEQHDPNPKPPPPTEKPMPETTPSAEPDAPKASKKRDEESSVSEKLDESPKEDEALVAQKKESPLNKSCEIEKQKSRVALPVFGFGMPRQLNLNVVVVLMVSMALAIYLSYNMRKSGEAEREQVS